MSRIRTIKPEFWTSEQVISCSPLARLLFIGLWNFCDDNGVHPASYVRIKAEVFPVDSFTLDEIKKCITELINNDLLREYVVENKTYWIVTGWKTHQRIDKPTYRHPLPQSQLKTISDNSTTTPRAIEDMSSSTLGIVEDSSTTEWKGMEGKGKDKEICEVKTSPCSDSEKKSSANTQEIFEHWQTVMNHPRAKLDSKRKHKITQAFKLGYSLEELKQAINGCSKTPFNMGENDRKEIYDDIELIFRDAVHIDRFIRNAENISLSQSQGYTSNIMTGVV